MKIDDLKPKMLSGTNLWQMMTTAAAGSAAVCESLILV